MLLHHRPSALLAAAGIVAGTVLLAPAAVASPRMPFSIGSNGAIAAMNTYVSTFAAGDRLR